MSGLKKGDWAIVDCPKSLYHGVKLLITSEPYDSFYGKLVNCQTESGLYLEGCSFKYLKPIEIEPPPPASIKPTWKDVSDMSELLTPAVHAYVSYAADGSCWEWQTLHEKGPIYLQSGKGRSIDRVTAKSDAEFFINNYKPEDTSERDELRAKLERSWHGK